MDITKRVEELPCYELYYEAVKDFCIYVVPCAKLKSCKECCEENLEQYRSCFEKVNRWKMLRGLDII